MNTIYITRAIEQEFKSKIKPGRVLILTGSRRVGKTVLVQKYLEGLTDSDYLLLHGEDQHTLDLLSERSHSNYKRMLGGKKLLVIDEAQKVPEIGLKLKVMVDTIPDVSIIATGSSVFDLTNKIGEPLVGRSVMLHLYPLSQLEFAKKEDY
ncbi:MAG: AAA family ATPase, partial [Bacteroidales bacterium]|nr:AAA family ATPase [Bacteroidales bacterium]